MAPTCFGLRPSSGSLQLSLAKIILILKQIYVVIFYAVVWQHVSGMARIRAPYRTHAATPPLKK